MARVITPSRHGVTLMLALFFATATRVIFDARYSATQLPTHYYDATATRATLRAMFIDAPFSRFFLPRFAAAAHAAYRFFDICRAAAYAVDERVYDDAVLQPDIAYASRMPRHAPRYGAIRYAR